MGNRRVGSNLNLGNIFKVCLRWWECDYVIVLLVLMVKLGRSFEFWGVLESIVK